MIRVPVVNGQDGRKVVGDVKVKIKYPLERAMKAQRGNRGIALLFL
jgi:hypothetical protein